MSLRRPDSDIDAAASDWAVRRAAGLTQAEEAAFLAWIASDEAHAAAFDRLSALSDAFARARRSGAAAEISSRLRIRGRRRVRRRMLAGLAAAVVIAAAFVRFRPVPSPESAAVSRIAATAGERVERLPDGSVMDLNSGAEAEVRYTTAERRVTLVRGEALFRVRKDHVHPFIVQAAGISVRAVGTAFNVRLAGSSVEVLVTEGRVGVTDTARGASLLPQPGDGAGAVLAAGERALIPTGETAHPVGPAQVAAFPTDEIERRLAWTRPRIAFDGTPLAAAAAQLNRTNVQQIVVADGAAGRLRISGTFASDDPQTFARLAAVTLDLVTETAGDGSIVLRSR